jgi:hypothetical protein
LYRLYYHTLSGIQFISAEICLELVFTGEIGKELIKLLTGGGVYAVVNYAGGLLSW